LRSPQWAGEDIPLGSAVGFKRTEYDPGYFHAVIAVGATTVRGTNSYVSTPDWSEPFDLHNLEQQNGHYVLDGQPIEVWYV
jgi:hypothetical protein